MMHLKVPPTANRQHLRVASRCAAFGLIVAAFACEFSLAADWKPAAGPLATRWAKDVSPEEVASSYYPRPQLSREEFTCLNGLWDYAIRPRNEPMPKTFDGTILVPFPVESSLSGVMKRVGPEREVWYRRTISVPEGWHGRRTLLHFEAVDWDATVWLDGKKIGAHRGGYTPFTFDITDALSLGKPHELTVRVWDPSDAGTQPCGKQHNKPEGIWYTTSTGIWQTVWMEQVPQTYVRELHFDVDVAATKVNVTADLVGPTEGWTVRGYVSGSFSESKESHKPETVATAKSAPGKPLMFSITKERIRLWSPDSPFLYDVVVALEDTKGAVGDRIVSYVALRTISISEGRDGQPARILLNGKPTFAIGPLDQGFWPDGLYTAPTEEALRSDIEVTKRLGFNLIRKHVKVEPARWYYLCDKLGILVWQDMPSGDLGAKSRSRGGPVERTPASAADYDAELKEMIDARRHFPCIITWVPFNEGWGQFDTVRITKWIKSYDPSRLVIPASGWNDFPVGDIHDIHDYPGPKAPPGEAHRAVVLGEFGGLGLPVAGHLWVDNKKNWGYRRYKTRDELTNAYLELAKKLQPLIDSRLSAAVYTQTTDVENEVNGLMTYDRELIKMDADKVRQANLKLRGE